MSGVRNLRAMFEQKGENNPPDRGRSPGPGGVSVGSPSPSHSPRPLSKVRTTFVAIEKDGRVGLRREHSGDSVSVSSRRLSNDTEATTPQPMSEKTDVFVENMAKNTSAFKTNLSQEAIPESPISGPPSKFSPKKDAQSPKLAPNPNPDKVTDAEETKTRLLPGNPTEKSATRGSSVTPTGAANSATNGKSKTAAKPAPKAVPVSTAKTVSKALKSPNTAKPTMTTTKPSTSTTSLASQKKAQPALSKDNDAPKKTAIPAAAKVTVTAGKKPAAINLPPSGTGFVKPKPKSPTRPLQLPASLTAPTAAYASKLGNGNTSHPPRQSLSRASGNAQHLNVGPTLHRSPSRASISTVGTTSNTRSLKRQSSTISRPRPSLGPPPKQTARDHPLAKKEAHVDEGFLARMMRPTQASSSKTSEKAPVTPPRKQSAPATVHKKVPVKDTESSAKKVAAKIQASTNKAKTAAESAKPVDKEAPSAKEVAPVVAQTETAEAAIETAQVSADTIVTPAVEEVASEENETGKKEEITEMSPEPVPTVPSVTEDPQKVEDIEDVVQELVEDSVNQTPVEPAVEVATTEEPEALKEVQEEQPKDEANDEAPAEQVEVIEAAEEPKVEEPTIEEEPETEEPKALEAEEFATDEAKEVDNMQAHEAKPEVPPENP